MRSKQLFEKAQHYMPGGVNSPVRAFNAVGGTPPYIDHAKGAYLYDADGKRYIDYVGSWGPMIVGHSHPFVLAAVENAVKKGLSFGACCEAEIALAEKVCALMPTIEKLRFVNSGTEATMSALRLARAYTKRDKFIKFAGCYHGHADSFLVQAGSGALTFGHPSSPGVPIGCTQDTLMAEFNDLESVVKLFETYPNDIACVILEPLPGNMNCVPPKKAFLEGLRELCDQYGALLIFDEVMSGFRVAKGGMQALYKIKPDLTTLGKVIGGGMPVGAFGGRAEIMDLMAPMGPVYQAGTLSGNPIAMTAGKAMLDLIDQPGFYEDLNRKTEKLMHGLKERADKADVPFQMNYFCGFFGFFFTEEAPIDSFAAVKTNNAEHFNAFFHHMLGEGIYLAPSMFEAGFVSSAHSDADTKATLSAAEKAFERIAAFI